MRRAMAGGRDDVCRASFELRTRRPASEAGSSWNDLDPMREIGAAEMPPDKCDEKYNWVRERGYRRRNFGGFSRSFFGGVLEESGGRVLVHGWEKKNSEGQTTFLPIFSLYYRNKKKKQVFLGE